MLVDIETKKTITFMQVSDGSYIISTKYPDRPITTMTRQNGGLPQILEVLLSEMGVGDMFRSQILQAVSCIVIGRLDRLRNIK